ncbi:MAG: hypothetical protein KME29_16265 [Calothrix sp. FI2-JRJ7]|nr:hypothetical protein [Calothrix sp. FI2-JRJ7]
MSTHKPNLLAKLNFKSPCYLYKIIQTDDVSEINFQECFAISVFRPIWNFGEVDWSDEKLVMEEKLRRFRESFKDKPEEWRKIEEDLVRRNISLETYLYS